MLCQIFCYTSQLSSYLSFIVLFAISIGLDNCRHCFSTEMLSGSCLLHNLQYDFGLSFSLLPWLSWSTKDCWWSLQHVLNFLRRRFHSKPLMYSFIIYNAKFKIYDCSKFCSLKLSWWCKDIDGFFLLLLSKRDFPDRRVSAPYDDILPIVTDFTTTF